MDDEVTQETTMAPKKLPPIHPGEVLREEYLVPMGLTSYALAKALGVPRTRIERLANEQTAMTADTALRLARYFGVPAASWMNLQARYDIETTEDEMADVIAKIEPRAA
jgi:antitoxin HigA-1